VTLLDEGAGVVDGLCEAALEDEGLETALEKVGRLQVEAAINAILVLREDTVAVETAHEGLSLKETLGVVLLKGQEGTGGLSDLGEGEVDAPDFALATEAELSAELELSVKTLTFEGATGSLGDLSDCCVPMSVVSWATDGARCGHGERGARRRRETREGEKGGRRENDKSRDREGRCAVRNVRCGMMYARWCEGEGKGTRTVAGHGRCETRKKALDATKDDGKEGRRTMQQIRNRAQGPF